MPKKQPRANQPAPRRPGQKLYLLRGSPADKDIEKVVDDLLANAMPLKPEAKAKRKTGQPCV